MTLKTTDPAWTAKWVERKELAKVRAEAYARGRADMHAEVFKAVSQIYDATPNTPYARYTIGQALRAIENLGAGE
jgi:hypothetical protein